MTIGVITSVFARRAVRGDTSLRSFMVEPTGPDGGVRLPALTHIVVAAKVSTSIDLAIGMAFVFISKFQFFLVGKPRGDTCYFGSIDKRCYIRATRTTPRELATLFLVE